MTNSNHRDMMGDLYRLWEKYENPPRVVYTEDLNEYWSRVRKDTETLFDKYADDVVCRELIFALFAGLEKNWRLVNPNPTIDKPQEPTQLSVF